MFTLIEKFIRQYAFIIIGLFGLAYLGNTNYLLFHSIIEVGGIVLGCMIITIFINSKDFNLEHTSFELLGIAYIFITFFSFLHTIFFKGMFFFSIESSNVSIQLYIIKQYMESISLFLFVCCYNNKKRINIKLFTSLYMLISCFILLLVFYWSIFPICFIEGYGVTLFVQISLLMINLFSIITTILLFKKRKNFHNDTFKYLLYSIVFTIFTGIFFMIYKDVEGILAVIGHMFKAVSIYLMYKAIVQVRLISPLIKLRDNEQKYHNLIELLPEAIFVHSPREITLTNLAGLKILGFENYGQLKGKSLWDFIYFKNLSIKEYKQLPDSQEYEHEELVIVQKCGKRVEVKITTTHYEKKSTMIIIHDISEQKKAERLKAKLKEEEEKKLKVILHYEQLKSNFYINITHEFKTPLNVLLAICKLLEQEDVPEKWESYINIAKQNCYRLWRLINNLIDNSKIDAKSFEIEMSNYNIVQVVEEITLSVADYLNKSSISITFDTDIEEKFIACDPRVIERILLNLISNGIKFSKEKGNILVNIVDGIDYVTIEVEDDGIGIDEDKINSIFDTFTKADDSLTRKSEGCGLGLSIVSSLVDIHGGTIEVHSKKGHGSKFVTKIPAKKSQLNPNKIHEVPIHKEKISIEFSDIYSE